MGVLVSLKRIETYLSWDTFNGFQQLAKQFLVNIAGRLTIPMRYPHTLDSQPELVNGSHETTRACKVCGDWKHVSELSNGSNATFRQGAGRHVSAIFLVGQVLMDFGTFAPHESYDRVPWVIWSFSVHFQMRRKVIIGTSYWDTIPATRVFTEHCLCFPLLIFM